LCCLKYGLETELFTVVLHAIGIVRIEARTIDLYNVLYSVNTQLYMSTVKGKGKVIPTTGLCGPEGG